MELFELGMHSLDCFGAFSEAERDADCVQVREEPHSYGLFVSFAGASESASCDIVGLFTAR